MATPADFMEYIVDQVGRAVGGENVSVRKMFGEYALYYQGTTVGLICDSTLFIKISPGTTEILGSHETGFPYPGAKPWYQIDETDLDDSKKLHDILDAAYDEAVSKKKKRK